MGLYLKEVPHKLEVTLLRGLHEGGGGSQLKVCTSLARFEMYFAFRNIMFRICQIFTFMRKSATSRKPPQQARVRAVSWVSSVCRMISEQS